MQSKSCENAACAVASASGWRGRGASQLNCTDDVYFAPLAGLKLHPETELYLGLVQRDDMAGNAARLAAARRHVRVAGVATECGMARGDPERFPALLEAHAQTAELGGVV